MTITLYTNNSENERLTKSLTQLLVLTGTLKRETSLFDPTIIITGSIISQLSLCNYVYISDFARWYFVKDIVSINNNVWELTLHVDVLYTYRTQIRAQTCVIKRQENNYNLHLDDGLFKCYQNPQIVTKDFPNGFSSHSYILCVSGG